MNLVEQRVRVLSISEDHENFPNQRNNQKRHGNPSEEFYSFEVLHVTRSLVDVCRTAVLLRFDTAAFRESRDDTVDRLENGRIVRDVQPHFARTAAGELHMQCV